MPWRVLPSPARGGGVRVACERRATKEVVAPQGTWTTLGRYVRPNVVHVPGAAGATLSRWGRSPGPAPQTAPRRRPLRGALPLADPPPRWLRRVPTRRTSRVHQDRRQNT